MTRDIFALSSFANAAAGVGLLILVATGVSTDPPRAVPVIAIAVGSLLLIQGSFSLGYAQRWWESWGSRATGVLLAGQLASIVAGVATIAYAILYVPRASNGGVEPAPFFSGVAITVNALLALIVVGSSGALRPTTRGRAAS